MKNPPATFANGLARLGLASIASAADFWGRAMQITGHRAVGAMRERAGTALPASQSARSPDLLRQVFSEFALLPGLALERFASEVSGAAAAARPSIPRVRGRAVPFPARVRDAAQALALYLVPAERARSALAANGASWQPVDAGHGTTPFALFAVDYRDADLGTYHEIGAAFFVTFADAPLEAAMLIVDLPVNDRFACDAGREIWGYPKRLERIDFALSASQANCTLKSAKGDKPIVSVTFPRGGEGASTALPVPAYSVLNGRATRSVFCRTGAGEEIAIDGQGVTVEVHRAAVRRGDRLAVLLDGLEIERRAPVLRTWTEHMSGELGPPLPAGW